MRLVYTSGVLPATLRSQSRQSAYPAAESASPVQGRNIEITPQTMPVNVSASVVQSPMRPITRK